MVMTSITVHFSLYAGELSYLKDVKEQFKSKVRVRNITASVGRTANP